MSDIKQELDRIRDRISDPSFLANKGLSNEVGIHVFCYDPADELIVRDFVSRLKAESGTPYHIKECDLYEIFLRLLEDKRVLRSVDGLEEKRGKEYLLKQLQKIATPEALLEYMKYEPHEYGDVLWLYVTDLGVDRDYLHQGIGTELMETAHSLAGGEKDVAVYLVANENAIPFYEKLGMRKADDVMEYNHIEWTEFTVK